ncbi:MAG: tRNA uridine-5-carboxymethylaminomethyl(34) synthesis GTPase MnmE [Kofleriaceae bacterium]
MQETIAAIATGAGAGGVGVIRVSGPLAVEIVAGLVALPTEELGRTVRYAVARDGTGARLDDVLVFAMRAPRSFTGEDVAEVHGHGGAINLARLLRAVVERGARVAQPGEFSRRAFDNGKLDALRAEALLGVIEAGSERAWRLAQAQLGGALGRRIVELEDRAVAVLAEVEGAIDFPEEDLEERGVAWLKQELSALGRACDELERSYRGGLALRSGVTAALVGATNAGKSSLLNALIGQERALVSEEPGTTRDYVEAQVEWDGVKVTLIDTAGWREVPDGLEAKGMALGQRRAEEADVVLLLSEGGPRVMDEGAFGGRVVHVRSKVDLGGEEGDERAIRTSVRTGEGLDALRRRVLEVAGLGELGDGEVLVTERQRAAAASAKQAFERASVVLERQPRELVAYDIREGLKYLTSIRGAELDDRVIGEIFSRFCIGK